VGDDREAVLRPLREDVPKEPGPLTARLLDISSEGAGLVADVTTDHVLEKNREIDLRIGRGDRLSVGDNSGLGEGARIVGDVTIGNDVLMSFNVFITAYDRDFSRTDVPIREQGDQPDVPVVIEDDVLILANTMILPGVRIGRGAVIAGGAVVSRSVPPWAIVAGNPARIVKWRKAPEEDALQPGMTPVAKPELDPSRSA